MKRVENKRPRWFHRGQLSTGNPQSFERIIGRNPEYFKLNEGKTMNTMLKSAPSPESQQQLESLRQAVTKTLEKKRRLGQYAGTWKDGKPVIAGEDAPEPSSIPSA